MVVEVKGRKSTRNEAMKMFQRVTLSRDCEAIVIPDGTPIMLAEGTGVTLNQALGGTYTVCTDQGMMVRIGDQDADAVGEKPQFSESEDEDGLTLEEKIDKRLRTCFDPEIPVNIVDLGLVYERRITEHAEGGYDVAVTMTLTAPGCGMGDVLAADVRQKLLGIRDVRHVEVTIVFDPPWDRSRMSEAAQLQLGMI